MAGKTGKRLKKIHELVDNSKFYAVDEAIKLIKDSSAVKFDETVEIAVNLGVDPKYSDQMVRGVVSLPAGTGKKLKIAVFAKGAKAEEAKKAGADIIGDDDLIEQIKDGNIDFDKCIATPDMMASIGKIAKVLGPKGLMPNPKLGTVTTDIAKAVENIKAGQVEFKVEKNGIVHAGIGKVSFSADKIKSNIAEFMAAVNQAKPSGAKGIYLQAVSLSSTMGLGLKIDLASLSAKAA